MDNLLQMKIIRQDTRGLFVPTSIEKVVIDIKTHLQSLQAVDEEVKSNEMPNILVFSFMTVS